jgi:E3 ubiquitin-protein ligase DOA10
MLQDYEHNESFCSEKEKVELSRTLQTNLHSDDVNLCRICFSELLTDDNPLISPCRCSGSLKYIHLDCLRTWLSRKENVKTSVNVISYSWKAFHCELCKSEYNDRILLNGR